MQKKIIKIGTRSSKLAIRQTKIIIHALQKAKFGQKHRFVIVPIKTNGDARVEGTVVQGDGGFKGIFTKEIHQALLRRDIDMAVHSVKDLPSVHCEDKIILACVPKRCASNDGFFSYKYKTLRKVPIGGTIGTSSIRRKELLLHIRPDLNIISIRGNIDTRLRKMNEMNLDGIILSYCGPQRMKFLNKIKYRQKLTELIPAIGQGAIGVEILQTEDGNIEIQKMLKKITCNKSLQEISWERSLAVLVNADCQTPLACNVNYKNDNEIKIRASFINSSNGKNFFGEQICNISNITDAISEFAKRILEIK